MTRSLWSVLGIKATRDEREIRRAYARRLKIVHPEDDPAGFQALRAAYDQALTMARRGDLHADALPDDMLGPEPCWAGEEERVWEPEPTPEALPEDPPLRHDADGERAHRARLETLHRALEKPAPAAEEVVSALLDIVRSDEMSNLSRHGRTEAWVADLIMRGGPGTQALAEPAIHYFGWTNDWIRVGRATGGPSIGQQVLAHLDRRREVDLTLKGGTEHADALKALTRPPSWRTRLAALLTPGLDRRVAAFLDGPRWRLPELQTHLDAAALDWWTRRLDGPRFSPVATWAILLAPPLAAAFVAASGPPGSSLSAFARSWALMVFAVAAPLLGWRFVVAEARWRWRRGLAWKAPRWVHLGWAPALLALLPLAGVLPDSPWSLLIWIPVPVPVFWAVVVGEANRDPEPVENSWAMWSYISLLTIGLYLTQVLWRPGMRYPWLVRAVLAYFWLGVFWLVGIAAGPAVGGGLSQESWLRLAAPILGAAIAFSAGSGTLIDAWAGLSITSRRIAAGLIATVAIVGVALLWQSAALRPLGVALIAAAVVAHKIPAFDLTPAGYITRDLIMRFGWVVWPIVLAVVFGGLAQVGEVRIGGVGLAAGGLVGVLARFASTQPPRRRYDLYD